MEAHTNTHDFSIKTFFFFFFSCFKTGYLEPGEVEGEQRHERKHELGHHGPGELVDVGGQEAGVEVGAVEDGGPHVPQEEAEVPVVAVADAVADEHAVVLPLEDADPADGAVPGARRLNRLAGGAELPPAAAAAATVAAGAPRGPGPVGGVGGGAGGGEDDVPGGGVGQPQPDKVAHDVEQEEGAEGGVDDEGDGGGAVKSREDQLKKKEKEKHHALLVDYVLKGHQHRGRSFFFKSNYTWTS